MDKEVKKGVYVVKNVGGLNLAAAATKSLPPNNKCTERVLIFRGSMMILPQVHLRKPCYDFYFL
jgi:hypothetical protein